MSEPQDRPPGRPPGSLPPQRPAGASCPAPGDRPLPPHLDPRAPRRPSGSRRTTPLPAHDRPPGPPRGRLARALSLLAVFTSFTVLATAVGGYVLVNKYDRQISRIDGVFDISEERPAETPRDARNLLIAGPTTAATSRPARGRRARAPTS